MECIICQDKGSEPLQDNTLCSCKYKTHNSCWIDYVHSKDKITCPLCRRDISVKPVATVHTPLIQHSAPQISPPIIMPYIPSQGQQISYQEFVEIIRQHTTPQNTVINIPSSQTTLQQHIIQQPNTRKLTKIIVGISIIFVILIIFIIIIKIA